MRGVVFDLDETLIDRHLAVTHFAENLWKEFFSTTAQVPESFLAQVHQLDGHGYTIRDEFFESMLEVFPDNLPSKAAVEEKFYGQVWETPCLADGVMEYLSLLQREKVPLAIVTNGSAKAQQSKIEHSGISDFFEAIVISESFGVKKPDPAIYQEAASRLKARTSDCWFVGDHPVNDIWGSKQQGFSTAWVHLNRPWSPAVERCYDLKGRSFRDTMEQLLESI